MKFYLETTMFNYYFDEARDGHIDTVRMFEVIKSGEYEGYTSQYTILELQKTNEPKQSNMLALINKYKIKVLELCDEAVELANLYIRSGVIPERYLFDGLHIAIASVHELDCILSFNFQHINKLKTKRMTAQVNQNAGYKGVAICTPMEVLDYEET